MNDRATRAELEKLARILKTDIDSVAFLGHIDAARLRTLREGIVDALFARFRDTFARFARLSGLLPMAVSTRIAEHVLGPTLAARVAGEMPPAKAIELAMRLPDSFLADTCQQLDPRRADAMIAGFPVDRAIAVTRELLERREAIVMGHFMDVLPTETLFAATDAIEDEADLLEISFFVEDRDQLDRVVAHLTPERQRRLIRAAAQRRQWPEIVTTLQRVGPDARAELARSALAEDPSTLESFIDAAAADELWPALIEASRDMTLETRIHLLQHPALKDRALIRSAMDSMTADAVWIAFTSQYDALGERGTARLIQIVVRQRPDFLALIGQQVDIMDQVTLDNLRSAVRQLGPHTYRRALSAAGGTELADLLSQPDND